MPVPDSARLAARLESLALEKETAAESLKTAERALDDGSGTAADVALAQAAFSAVETAIGRVEGERAGVELAEAAERETANREAILAALARTADDARSDLIAFYALMDDANAYLSARLAEAGALADAHHRKRKAFFNALRVLHPEANLSTGSVGAAAADLERAGVDVDAVAFPPVANRFPRVALPIPFGALLLRSIPVATAHATGRAVAERSPSSTYDASAPAARLAERLTQSDSGQAGALAAVLARSG